jgi:hypothetical protein
MRAKTTAGRRPPCPWYANYFARWLILQQLPLQHGPLGQQFFAVAKLAPTVMAASAAMLKTTFVILFIAILLF